MKQQAQILNTNKPNENTPASVTGVPQEVGDDVNNTDDDAIKLNDDHLSHIFP